MVLAITVDLELPILIVCGLIFSLMGRVWENPVFDVFGAVTWFATSILWLISSNFNITSILFMGCGIIMVLYAIVDGVEMMRTNVEEGIEEPARL